MENKTDAALSILSIVPRNELLEMEENIMEILLDTANLEQIKKYMGLYEITGVTSNPTIISRENAEFWPLLTEIKNR